MKPVSERIGAIIKVAYNPEFTIGFLAFVKTYVNPSSSSNDGEHQYHIEAIHENIEGMEFKMNIEDQQLLDYLYNSKDNGGLGVEYIEF